MNPYEELNELDIIALCQMIDYRCEDQINKGAICDLAMRGFGYNEHETIEIEHDGIMLNIDVNILPLIKKIWLENLETTASCQGDEKQLAYISFKNLQHLLRLCEIYPQFKQCQFDILNPNYIRRDLEQLTYNEIVHYQSQYDDLFTVRFQPSLLTIRL